MMAMSYVPVPFWPEAKPLRQTLAERELKEKQQSLTPLRLIRNLRLTICRQNQQIPISNMAQARGAKASCKMNNAKNQKAR